MAWKERNLRSSYGRAKETLQSSVSDRRSSLRNKERTGSKVSLHRHRRGRFGANRFLARGDFATQLFALRDEIPAVARGEIRVLVMHHSLMPAPPQSPPATVTPQRRTAFPRAMEITSGTRNVLDHFLVAYGIKVITALDWRLN